MPRPPKSLIMKINKGTAERPPMPEQGSAPQGNDEKKSKAKLPIDKESIEKGESEDDLINRLVADGADGKMDEINNLENKVIRGKIKAAIVKAKRSK